MVKERLKRCTGTFAGVAITGGMALVLGIHALPAWYTGLRAHGFPTVRGVVTDNSIEQSTDSDGSDWYHPQIRYEYVVDGTTHFSNMIRGGVTPSRTSHASAREYLDSTYPVGREVTVHYDPSNADRSVLELGLSGGDFALAAVLSVFLAIFLGMLKLGYGQIRWALRPTAGGLRWSRDHEEVKVRLRTESALGTAVSVTVVLSAMGITGGSFFSLSLWLLWGIAGVCALLGVSLYAGMRAHYRRHGRELIIDETTVTAPPLSLSDPDVESTVIPRERIQSIYVDHTMGDNDNITTPAISWLDDAEKLQRTPLVHWAIAERSKDLVQWLEEILLPQGSEPSDG